MSVARLPTGVARPVVAVSLSLTAAVVPVFLVGALSTQMRDDLRGPGSVSIAVTALFVGAGLSAVPMGRVADAIGARRALRTGVTIAGGADLLIATVADAWWQVALILLVAGVGVGLVDTGGARAFSDALPDTRHGLAFGAKEASVPAASLLAGVSIPLLAQAHGWRTVFVVAIVLTPVVWLVVPSDVGSDGPARVDAPEGPRRARRGPLLLFATGVALGTGAATAAATLLVPAFDDRGWSESAAGVLLAAASVCSIAMRLTVGARSDRRPVGSWRTMTVLMAVGAVGALLLTPQDTGAVAVLGAVLVIGAGWGWTGLAFQTAVRVNPGAPARAAGTVLAGLSAGGVAGPAAFGALSAWVSFGAAWATAAVAFVAGAGATAAARRLVETAA